MISPRGEGASTGSALRRPWTKNGGADAHHGCPFLNRHFKIMGHAHGQFRHRYIWEARARDLLGQGAQLNEMGSGVLGDVDGRWHAHQPFHSHAR
jgi:hypothetical protein